MQKLEIPVLYSNNAGKKIVAIEGCNGVGKSTLLSKYLVSHPEIKCILGVPEIYQTQKFMKKFMMFEACAMCSALYYTAGSIELRNRENLLQEKNILLDRSIWSTFAAAYAKEEKIICDLFACLEVLKDYVFIPNKLVVLEASYDTCRNRSLEKKQGGEFDRDNREEFLKKANFYRILADVGYDITFIKTDYLSKDEVFQLFEKTVKPFWV